MKLTTKFLLNHALGNEADRPVYLQLTLDRKTTKRAIGHSCHPKDWNDAKEESRLPKIQQTILGLRGKINDLTYELQKQPRELSVTQFADLVFDKEKLNISLAAFFQEFADNLFLAKTIGAGTYGQYKTTLRGLKEYIQVKYNKPDIDIDHIDFNFIDGFNIFLSQKGLDLNTVSNKYHKKLKSALIHAIKQGHISKKSLRHVFN